MSDIPTIDPQTLSTAYPSATDTLMLVRAYADLLMEQEVLDLGTSTDSGLAYTIKICQCQMRIQAGRLLAVTTPAYIQSVRDAANFCNLWDAAVTEVTPILRSPTSEGIRNVAQVYQALGQQAGINNLNAADLGEQLDLCIRQLTSTNTPFKAAVNSAIASLESSTKALSDRIDKLNAQIQQNIQDIVAGADKVGTATSDLLNGILTSISGSKKDPAKSGGDGSGDKPGADGSGSGDKAKPDVGSKPAASQDKGADAKGDDRNQKASTEFVVTSIKGATSGAAETAQARADLNANNVLLAHAIQQLAQDDALIAVAKVVLAQNDMLLPALKDLSVSVRTVSTTWGVPPIQPPGSGISLSFYDSASAAAAVRTAADAEPFLGQIQYQNTKWHLLNSHLATIQNDLVGA